MKATVIKPGPLSTVQDLGRSTGARQGLAPGGAMDRRAFLWANRLLGNPAGVPMLEVTLGGLELSFHDDCRVAVTGADCGLSLDGGAERVWKALTVRSGQTLKLGFAGEGMRAYLAFPGGLVAPRFQHSASQVLREGLQSVTGGPLRESDMLTWRARSRGSGSAVPMRFRSLPGSAVELPFMPGYEWAQFSREDRDRFRRSAWIVTPASDRTATRLEGPPLASGPRVLDSVPLVDGTIQVTGDGLPLVFMRDRPTIGGYAKLGSVLPHALNVLAQARPGTAVRFKPGDPVQARAEAVRVRSFFGL